MSAYHSSQAVCARITHNGTVLILASGLAGYMSAAGLVANRKFDPRIEFSQRREREGECACWST